MDRFAIFVDTEHLYAAGGLLCCNSPERQEILLNGLGANDYLIDLATDACGLRALRAYWYDSSSDGAPTQPQKLLATLPNLKLRLQHSDPRAPQSPLSAAIRRDLTSLASNGAICEAFLLATDEDLLDCVRDVQDLGLRVTVFAIESLGGRRAPPSSLTGEADDVIDLTKDYLSRFIRRRHPPDDGPPEAYGSRDPRDRDPRDRDPRDAAAAAAADFAESWLDRATDDEFDSLLDQRPRIPESLDGDLLFAVENVIGGSLRGQDRLRRAVRQAFWDRIDQEVEDWPPDEYP